MASTNQQVLTRGGRKLAAKRAAHRVESVDFDPQARQDYLTGFHKRKLQRQADAKRKAEEFAHKQHLEERRKMRETRKKSVSRGLERLQEAQASLEAGNDKSDSESDNDLSTSKSKSDSKSKPVSITGSSGKQSKSHSQSDIRSDREDNDHESDDEEFKGFGNDSGILKTTYGDAQVTVQPVDIHGHVDPFVDMSRSEQVLDESTRKAHEYAQFVEGLERSRSKPQPKKLKPRKKKFRYRRP